MNNKISDYLTMHRNARYYGLSFFRRATFKPPQAVASGRPICYPDEAGVKTDFIEIFLRDVYRIRTVSAPLTSILDIGANSGFFSIAASLNHHEAIIHAYEPNPALSPYIDVNANTYAFRRFPEAVGGHNGTVSLQTRNESNMTNTRDDPTGNVAKLSLDDVVQRLGGSIDFMKMDCEGAEWEMFAESKSWPLVSRIAMEYHISEGQSHDSIIHTLARLKFAIIDHLYDPSINCGLIFAINPARTERW